MIVLNRWRQCGIRNWDGILIVVFSFQRHAFPDKISSPREKVWFSTFMCIYFFGTMYLSSKLIILFLYPGKIFSIFQQRLCFISLFFTPNITATKIPERHVSMLNSFLVWHKNILISTFFYMGISVFFVGMWNETSFTILRKQYKSSNLINNNDNNSNKT